MRDARRLRTMTENATLLTSRRDGQLAPTGRDAIVTATENVRAVQGRQQTGGDADPQVVTARVAATPIIKQRQLRSGFSVAGSR